MNKLIQTRVHKGNDPKERGNCYPTVMACIMDLKNSEEAFQIQEHYDNPNWMGLFVKWINEQGWMLEDLYEHQDDNEFYFVTGPTMRDKTGFIKHICIYLNGKLYWDPHPDNTGLTRENIFSRIIKIK